MVRQHNSERQVVVTGLGVVSPLGNGIDPFWECLRTGTSGIRPVTTLAYNPAPGPIAGEIRDFNPSTFARTREQKKAIRVMCREIQLGYGAATQAMDDSGIKEGTVPPERLGVEFGANLMFSIPEDLAEGCFATMAADDKFHHELWATEGMPRLFPLWLLKYLPNMPACHIGISADARGPNNSITLDEASSNLVIGEALRVINRGDADVMISGATGTRLHALKSVHARLWDELAHGFDEPARACRPFDARRSGQVIGEGAGSFILEDRTHAEKRGAKMYARILGAGSACVATKQGPDLRKALALSMQAALRDAKLEPPQIGHINAHGLSDRHADEAEAQAICDVFGAATSKVPVTAVKSFLGNSAAGCGALELLASVVSLKHGAIPPTLNYENPDPNCPIHVARELLPASNKIFLKNNVTRLGQASTVIIQGI